MSKALTELIRDANRNITPADRHAILDLIEQQADRIAALEAQIAPVAPAVDAPTDDWDTERLDAAIRDYATVVRMAQLPQHGGMQRELRQTRLRIHEIAKSVFASSPKPAVDAQPVAWRIFDGEGGYDYRDEPPPEVNVAWAAKHGRKYEPLYTEPQSSQSAQSEPVAWANVKDDGTIVGLSQHPEDIANWQNPRPLCYQCKGCGDSEYGPWRCSRCEGSGFESAPNAAQSEGLRKAITEIAEQEHVELMLDPTWAQRIAIAALSQHTGEKDD